MADHVNAEINAELANVPDDKWKYKEDRDPPEPLSKNEAMA
jgi:hypothetical protein